MTFPSRSLKHRTIRIRPQPVNYIYAIRMEGVYVILACLFALLFTTVIMGAEVERRTALVIGNATYATGPLRNPVNDATDMSAALRQVGFDVTLLRDANLRTMLETIEAYSRKLRHGGVGLFYYAGHAVQVNGENYLIPLQARIAREQDVQYEAVPVGRVLGGMEDAGNPLNIVILDACRDNPFARQWRSNRQGLATTQAARGTLIAYATAPGAVAADGSGRNGLYTSQFLQYVTTPNLSVEQLFKKVRIGVVEATQGQQTPWESSSLIGDFFFVPIGPDSGQPPSASDPELEMWTALKKQSAITGSIGQEGLQAYLAAYPNGRFAPVAHALLARLQRTTTDSEGPIPTMVAVPNATIYAGAKADYAEAFSIDLKPVSNREFLEFTKRSPGWQKSRISSRFHDGDYLKHWGGGGEGPPDRELDLPVRYVSFYAATAYCEAVQKRLPKLAHYFAATNRGGRVNYESPYQPPDFGFTLRGEWTATPRRGSAARKMTVLFGTVPKVSPNLPDYSPDPSKTRKNNKGLDFTDRSLGFRCAKY